MRAHAGSALALLLTVAPLGAQTVYQWNGTTNSTWTTATNWTGSTVGVTGSSSNSRLNVYNGAGQTLIYSAAQGTTVYANATGRGLVISNANGSVAGSMEITGGSFSTSGSTQQDIIGNNATGTLTISGGTFIGAGTAAGGTIVGLNSGGGTSTLNISGTGLGQFSTLQLSGATTVVNLNGGTLAANRIIDVDNSGVTANSNTTFNFNGGTLQARETQAAFLGGLTLAQVRTGGAVIDTNGFNVGISQSLVHEAALGSNLDGGLTKKGTGTLTLTGTNTYNGNTIVEAGSLVVNGSIAANTTTTIQSGASIWGSGSVGNLTVNSGATINPGNSPGLLTVNGNYSQAGSLVAEITGLVAGSQYDQIAVNGSVNLSGSLSVQFSGSYQLDDTIFLILNDGNDAVTGTFSGLAQGATVVNYGGWDWVVSYNANSSTNSFTGGNDVALRAIPEPSATLLSGLGVLALLRRRRK